MLVAIVFIVMYLLCINEYYRVSVLRWTGIDLIVSGALGTIALIIFGVKGGLEFKLGCAVLLTLNSNCVSLLLLHPMEQEMCFCDSLSLE